MGFFDIFKKDRSKKIAQGSFGTIYTPNYACPNFEKRKGYISKMMKSKKDSEYELTKLKMIKKIDPKQKYLATFETSCASSERKYYKNIIMKNFGVALLQKGKKDFPRQTFDDTKNVFLKQTLESLMLLHKNNIYHLDMAERNILYKEDENRYRLIDFGLSTTKKEIIEAFKPANIKKAKDLEAHFEAVTLRGDGRNESFENSDLDELNENIENDDKEAILKQNLKKIANELAKEQEYADVQALLYIALFLTKKDEQDKTEKMLEKFLDKNVSAKQVCNKIFKKQCGGAKKRVVKKTKKPKKKPVKKPKKKPVKKPKKKVAKKKVVKKKVAKRGKK